MKNLILAFLLFSVPAWAVARAEQATLKEMELQHEIIKLRQTIAQMQIDYANLLGEFGGRETVRLKSAVEELQQQIEKKKKEK